MTALFENSYQGRTVMVTGHTGFKGAWLTLWLQQLGARVVGYSLPQPPTGPNLFDLLTLSDQIVDVRGDVCDGGKLQATINAERPSIVFHLAAQPIVLHSVAHPQPTFAVNALGTVNLLEAVRQTDSVDAVVCVTTDKVYADQGWVWGYRESDALGGRDPYSASKAMAELAIASYRATYFSRPEQRSVGIASVRAGNVIGGGDFGAYRLVPDCMRALLAEQPVGIRIPGNIRPWQHVLAPLSGYLWLGVKLLQAGDRYGGAWNFAPVEQKGISVAELVDGIIAAWGAGSWQLIGDGGASVETPQLRLNWDKAAAELDWHPVYGWQDAVAEIVRWFTGYQDGADMRALTLAHIAQFVQQARQQRAVWSGV